MNLGRYFKNLFSAVKGVPFSTYGGGGPGSPYGSTSFYPNQTYYPNTTINWTQEAGPLTSSSLVMVAVNWAGIQFAHAPIQVQKPIDNGAETIAGHQVTKLFERPNPYYSGPALWKALMLSAIIDGNMYIRKVRNAGGLGLPAELWYEPHFTTRVRYPADGSAFIGYYEVLRNGQWYRVETEDMIHIRIGIDPYNDRLGLSPVASAHREIFTDNERARYGAMVLKNGGVIPYILSPNDDTAYIDSKEVKKEFEYQIQGDNVGRPIVLSGPVKAQEWGATPEELLIDKASIIPEERLAALIGIPAAVLGFGAGLNQTKVGATMRELREQAYENFILPLQALIAAELNVQLLPEFGPAEAKVSFDLRNVKILQDDQDKLAIRQSLLYQRGVITRAEARRTFNLPTTPADDVYFVEKATPAMPPTPPNNGSNGNA